MAKSFLGELKQMIKFRKVAGQEIKKLAWAATYAAVNKASEMTPPTMNDLSGTKTRTGRMKRHWKEDSQIEPEAKGLYWVSRLKNNMPYAAYVNDGHRMDMHFVPGLIVNPDSGLLEMVDPEDADGKLQGIMVGTKTKYVPGLHMVEAATEVYDEMCRKGMDDLLKKVK